MPRLAMLWLLASAALGLTLALVAPTAASDDTFVIIVHAKNPVTSVDRKFVQNAFLRTATSWEHGPAIRPIDLPLGSPVRDRFTREVLGKTPAVLRNYWVQRIFSGTTVPPPVAESTTAAVAYVRANVGAIAYVPSGTTAAGTKVIALK